MAITASMVKELRERTGVGMMDCKQALDETNGDMEQAIEILRKKGIAKASKKSTNVAADGTVHAVVKDGTAVLVEINCQTDFVARGDKFKELVNSMTEQIFTGSPESVDGGANSLYAQKMSTGKTVKETLDEAIAEIGENIKVRRFEILKNPKAYFANYIHMNGKIGVVVEFDADASIHSNPDFLEMTKDISMHIAAMNPGYVKAEEIPAEIIAKEKEIYTAQANESGKPANVIEKMVEGMVKKFEKESCLLEQIFVKDNKLTVKDVVADVAKKTGKPVEVKRFFRFQLGEGIEKKTEDFAAEVNKMIGA